MSVEAHREAAAKQQNEADEHAQHHDAAAAPVPNRKGINASVDDLSENTRRHEPPSSDRWTCPMHPEVQQLEPGPCPKCGMALEFTGIHRANSTQYTCPMHPEVLEYEPGDCPKCGMALEPVQGHQTEENHELVDMTRRFWFAAVLTVPLVIIAMGDMLPSRPFSTLLPGQQRLWLEFALATPVTLYSAWPFFVRAVRSVVNRSLNMFTLIGLGVSVAYLYSVVATFAPQIFPQSFRGHRTATNLA